MERHHGSVGHNSIAGLAAATTNLKPPTDGSAQRRLITDPERYSTTDRQLSRHERGEAGIELIRVVWAGSDIGVLVRTAVGSQPL